MGSSLSGIMSTVRGRIVAIVLATVTVTMLLMMLTHGVLVATASEMSQNASVSNPTLEWTMADASAEGTTKVIVHVTLSEPDGYALSRDLGLSVALIGDDGQQIAVSKVVAPQENSETMDASFYRASAEMELPASQCDAVVGMRIVGDSNGGELDTRKFDKVSTSVTTESKRQLNEARALVEEQPVAEVEPQVEQRPRYSDTDFSDTFIIGDSVLALSAREGGYGDKIAEHIPGAEYDVESGRYFDSDVTGDPDDGMIDIARRVAGRYDRYVIECGINDAGLTHEMANEFISVLMRDDVQLFFVNQRVRGGADDTTCATIRDIVAANDRVYEVDWNSLCTGNEDAWLLDVCHPNDEGADKLTTLIHDVMVEHVADVTVAAEAPSETPTAENDDAPSAASVEEALAWRDSEDIDRADLRISTDAEIEAWGRRIDDYLSGTELGGYGHLFAECAARYQVDPRLSPAISTIESGNGAICAAPYNAWGWGGPGGWASWGSWEEAIEGHVSGLASNGYASMGMEECSRYCDAGYWDGDPSFCLKTEVLKI